MNKADGFLLVPFGFAAKYCGEFPWADSMLGLLKASVYFLISFDMIKEGFKFWKNPQLGQT